MAILKSTRSTSVKDDSVGEKSLRSRWRRVAPFRIDRSEAGRRIRVRWRPLLVWMVAGLIGGWWIFSTGLYFVIKYSDNYREVRYKDVVFLPWRLDEYRKAKGLFWIAEGMAATERNEWRDAFDLLRMGLESAPDQEEARIMIARIYLMAGRNDFAQQTLIEGLGMGKDPLAYAREVIGFLFSQQADDAVIGLTKTLIEKNAPDTDLHKLARAAQGIAYFNRDRFAESLAAFAAMGAERSPQALLLRARSAWEQGRKEEGIAQLNKILVDVPKDAEAYRALIVYLREDGRHGDIRRVAVARQLTLPDDAEAYIDFIQACDAEKDVVRRDGAEQDFLVHFGGDVSAMFKLGEYASRAGRVELAERVLQLCREQQKEPAAAALWVVAAEMAAGRLEAALQKADAFGAEKLGWNEMQRLYLDGLRTLILYGLGKEVEAAPGVGRLLDSRYLRANVATSFALKLQTLGQAEFALRLLRKAVEIDPLYQPALVALLREEVKAGRVADVLPLVERLPTMRKPPAELVATLRAMFESDRYLFLAQREELLKKLSVRRG